MLPSSQTPDVAWDNQPPLARFPALTPRRLLLFVIGWMVLFALLSIAVANPFAAEPSAAAVPDYARVMFLHGLLIGSAGLLALLACGVLGLRSRHAQVWIVGGVLCATVLAAIGGIFDRSIPGSEVPMWVQIFGFFALDEILLVLVVAIVTEWRAGRHELPILASGLAAGSMFGAALMGHLAGWIMEFGTGFPPVIGSYVSFAGFASGDDFSGALVGSHSHDMAVAVMAFAVILVAVQFGYATLTGAARTVVRLGLAMVGFGVVAMTALYVAMGFTTWGPPTLFVSGPDGANGIAGDDVVTGVLVMGGGLLVAAGLVVGHAVQARPIRLAALWAWLLSFATVVVAGFAIEMNESYFGAGDPNAAGAAKDAVFTWFHQDIGLFLLPAIVLVMLAAERLAEHDEPAWIGQVTIAGTSVAFLGGLTYIVVDPATYGPGYALSTIGLLLIGLALLGVLWRGADRTFHLAAPRRHAPIAR
jgi:uncharacterized membrane protein